MVIHFRKIIIRVFPAIIGLLISCANNVGEFKSFESDVTNSLNISKKNKDFTMNPGGKVQETLPPTYISPTFDDTNFLNDKIISIQAISAPLEKILLMLARSIDMNLVISSEVDKGQRVTVDFKDISAKEALDTLMDLTGLYYEIKGNTIFIKEFMTKIYKLPYIHAKTGFNSSLGGNVTGGGSSSGGGIVGGTGGQAANITVNTGISASYSVQYSSGDENTDFFKQIEEGLKNLLSEEGKYSLNKLTGVLIVTDRKRYIDKIDKFIKGIIKKSKKQVLIEAKVLEIILNKDFQYGIDWNLIIRNFENARINISQRLALPSGGYLNIGIAGGDFNSIIDVLQEFGKIETLSNPRVLVGNGQTAIITAGKSIPFFSRNFQQVTTAQTNTTTAITVNIASVLEGVILGVTPYIDDNKNVILNIVPITTKLEDVRTYVFQGETIAEAPIVSLRELGTVIKAKSGEVIVIGGLINKVKATKIRQLPILGSIPILGYLFKRTEYYQEKRELVILLKPIVLDEQ